jgi:mono/diheme cytochrome c family protein
MYCDANKPRRVAARIAMTLRRDGNVRKFSKSVLGAVALAVAAALPMTAMAEDPPKAESAPAADAAKPKTAAAAGGGSMTTLERVKAAPKGSLKNPFDYKDPKIVAEGKKAYLSASCNGCHGGGGGGGMCPPLTNERWVYGGDDDTLFRLITLGTDDLKKDGYSRIAKEVVVGPMPPFGEIVKDEEKLWKIIVYIRSVWGGRDKKIVW